MPGQEFFPQPVRLEINMYTPSKIKMNNNPYKPTPENGHLRTFNNLEKPIKAPVVLGHDRSNPACRTPWPRFGHIPYRALFEQRKFDGRIIEACNDGLDVMIYACGNPSLQRLARAFKMPLSKVGCTIASTDLRIRQGQLSRDFYGSGRLRDGEHVFEDDLWADWEMQTAELLVAPHALSPVQLMPRGLRVRLPAAMSTREFEKGLHRAVSRSALHNFARSEPGKMHFGFLDIDPTTVPRYVSYGFGNAARISLAHELYICRPREDWTRLKIIAEDLVVDFISRQAAQAA
jgi:hypothetical protein